CAQVAHRKHLFW
nr:immunoglobulin heavy chain junction region [Macaca mulatta]MOY23226.1 immunoglobulin heavy chain junction region [Macaca mulatta]MOY23988.1 immunoglobulin heavy chain junction region [Macaca mulatta]MOY24017.1 immunoglobulin heavy chain junction region [Macaca mulatta]MOY25402.1 immunoglobulin heavy chain junction region [Macaca mulatta]